MSGSSPDFAQIEIMDCFPQDHPKLFFNLDRKPDEAAKQMQDDLRRVIENKEVRND